MDVVDYQQRGREKDGQRGGVRGALGGLGRGGGDVPACSRQTAIRTAHRDDDDDDDGPGGADLWSA